MRRTLKRFGISSIFKPVPHNRRQLARPPPVPGTLPSTNTPDTLKYRLLSTLQGAIVLALIIIGATLFYALHLAPSPEGLTPATAPTANTETPANEAATRGKKVWRANTCGSCHARDMRNDATGPALAGVTDRWAAEPREHLYAWIRNSTALGESGRSARAAEMIDWSGTTMSRYHHITDEEIEDLLAYIER